jgi:FKBP-type peptidyl-prolyl cis-trans isomerase
MRRQIPLTVACLTVLAVLAGCGSSKSATSSTDSVKTDSSTVGSSTAGPTTKPKVKIPATLPTKLVITDLEEGTGPAAKAGDDVSVFYVGVRSADGT